MMTYKGYHGTVTFDEDAETFHGEVTDLRDVVTFQGRSVDELKAAFHESIDDYLEFCAERGEEPDRPYSGNFVALLIFQWVVFTGTGISKPPAIQYAIA